MNPNPNLTVMNPNLTVLKTEHDRLARLKIEGLMEGPKEFLTADRMPSKVNHRAAAAESERDTAITRANAAENERNQTVRRAIAAESERDFANQRAAAAESECDHAIERATKAEFERNQAVRRATAAERERDFANQRAITAESEYCHTIERAIKAEFVRDQAVARATAAESERDLANQRAVETNERLITPRLPSLMTWSARNKGPNLQLRNGGLDVVLDCRKVPSTSNYSDWMYDMTVSRIVGLGMSNKSPLHFDHLPGWAPETWGYHGDDGKRYTNKPYGVPYSERFKTGDTVGCGVDCDGRMFFTKNGNHLGSQSATSQFSSKC
ncbi:hypothetical protein BDD12DRAFT_936905 [Trichophaea hybrida]|nr:hypothetical protein BDD12DRAFT_936905 [Trichophaea hybrida]